MQPLVSTVSKDLLCFRNMSVGCDEEHCGYISDAKQEFHLWKTCLALWVSGQLFRSTEACNNPTSSENFSTELLKNALTKQSFDGKFQFVETKMFYKNLSTLMDFLPKQGKERPTWFDTSLHKVLLRNTECLVWQISIMNHRVGIPGSWETLGTPA